jgi:hypothetical protein
MILVLNYKKGRKGSKEKGIKAKERESIKKIEEKFPPVEAP